MTDKDRLWNYCENHIDRLEITCPEVIHQSDRVVESACDFIEGICDIVGYLESGE